MSRIVELLCLANSTKLRGRCVAGIDLGTGNGFGQLPRPPMASCIPSTTCSAQPALPEYWT
jgi:hypothetical protein